MANKIVDLADKPTLDRTHSATSETLNIINQNNKRKRYGVKIDKNNSDPEARIEYMYDAVGFVPAHMNYTLGKFSYGSWKDVWFVKENYPVMLKRNGEVAYKLDPNDYSKKEDGSDSDVANVNFDGNAMSRIPLIWVSMTEDDNYEYISVCEEKYDETYHAMAHTREDGTIVDEIFLAMFKGYLDDNNKLRSISGKSPMKENTVANEIARAKNNGSGWYTRTWGQRQLINALLTIIGKSDNTQDVFGTGVTNNADSSALLSGAINDKGQFYGEKNQNNHVKVFHIEDWWGVQNERIAGLICNAGTFKVSLTGPYNTTGEGYDTVYAPSAANGDSWGTSGFMKKVFTSKYGRVPRSMSGTSSTYLCDNITAKISSSLIAYPYVGGYFYDEYKTTGCSGAHRISVDNNSNYTSAYIGACLSFIKPI